MKLKAKLLSISAILLTGLFSTAHAWDGVVQGVIVSMDVVVATGNYDVRVVLVGAPALCSSGFGWAYVNTGDPNYQTTAAALMMAKATGSKVTLFTVKDAAGYCHIGYMSIV